MRTAGRRLGYLNSCPHVRLPLNCRRRYVFHVTPQLFLFCANHAARTSIPPTGALPARAL